MARRTTAHGTKGDGLSRLFQSLADPDRRRLLGHLHDRAPSPTTRDELASQLATWNLEGETEEPTTEEQQRALVDLHHVHLPKLEDVGLIDRDTDRNTVAIADHPAFDDSGVVEVVTESDGTDSRSLDALFSALSKARRRTVLDVLSHQYQEIKTETLAREVAADERKTIERNLPVEDVDQVLDTLRHVHLPKLAEAGLIDYDADEQLVAYEGHPALRVPWMHSQLDTDFRASLTESSKSEDVWTLEGRRNVVSCGQSLCEMADDELFMMFTTTGLLEAGCFTRITAAAERGVDVYLGTRDPAVREYVAEHAPEVTLWKPETDWLDLPVEGNRVGRLVFADREAIMLGTLGEKDDTGVHTERAMVGEGADNAFITLMRQMLNSRLEQFDDQSRADQAQMTF